MYEQGVLVAFLLWLYSVISTIIRKNSLLEKNMNKVGRRTTPTGLGVVDMKYPKDSSIKVFAKYSLVFGSSLLLILFSWLYVLVSLGFFVYRFKKDQGVPQSIKEYRWKLKNIDMTFDEIIKEIVKLEGLDESEYPRVRQEWVEHIDNLKTRDAS